MPQPFNSIQVDRIDIASGVWNFTTPTFQKNGVDVATTGDVAAVLPPQGGHAGQVLSTDGTNPLWSAAGSGSVTGSGVAGQVPFWTSATNISGDNGLFWDNTNKRLGIGSTSPSTPLYVFNDNNLDSGFANIIISNPNSGNNASALVGFYSDVAVGYFGAISSGFGVPYLASTIGFSSVSPNSTITFIANVAGGGGGAVRVNVGGVTVAEQRMIITEAGHVGINNPTPAQALDVIGNGLFSGTLTASNLSGTNTGNQTITLTGDVTGSGTGSFSATIANNAVTTAKIINNAVTYAKIQAISATSKLLGSSSTTTPVQEITVGSGLSLSGTTLSATGSGGTVTTVSVVTANGVSGSVATPTTTPAITLTLGAITPSSVASSGAITAPTFNNVIITPAPGGPATLTIAANKTFDVFNTLTLQGTDGSVVTVPSNASISGTNTGDQTITLTGDVTGSGTGSFATTIANSAVTYAKIQNVSANKLLGRQASGAGIVEEITLGTNLSLTGTTLNATGSGITGSGTTGQVTFWNGATSITGDNGLFWDNATKRLGIGTASPTTPLTLVGEMNTTGVHSFFTGTLSVSAASEGKLGYDNSIQHFVISENGGSYSPLLAISSVTLQQAYVGGQTIGENADGITITRSSGGDTLPLFTVSNTLGGSVQNAILASSNNGAIPLAATAVDASNNTTNTAFSLRHTVSGSPIGAAGVGVAQTFLLPSDAGNVRIGAKIAGTLTTVTDTAENGSLAFSVIKAGTLTNVANISTVGLVLNGATSGSLTLAANAVTTSHTLKFPAAQGAASTFLQNDGAGNLSWTGGSGGTVTSVSVVTANGFAGTVATATTTPAITLTTSITGILQGNGTAISAAPTTGSGNVVLSTSPVLTTPNIGSATGSVSGNAGTATALQTARTINGVSFDGTSNITVAAAAGTLTGSTLAAGVTASSLTSVGTITSGTWNGTAVDVAHGGTGDTTLTNHGVLLGQGTSPVVATSTGTSGQVLTSNGASADPTFQDAGASSVGNFLFSVTSDVSLAQSATTTIGTFTLAGGTLSTGNVVRLKGNFRFANTSGISSQTFAIKLTYGSTTLTLNTSAIGGVSTTNGSYEFMLMASGATNTQYIVGNLTTAPNQSFGVALNLASIDVESTTGAEDSTTGLTLKIEATLGANGTGTGRGLLVERIS